MTEETAVTENEQDTVAEQANAQREQVSESEKEAKEKEEKETVEDLKRQLDMQKRAYEESLKQEVKKAVEEEKRLSKLSEEERKKEVQEQKLKDIEKREQALLFKEKLAEVKEDLIKRNLPVTFAEYMICESADKTLQKITEFEKAFKKAVEDEVNKKIKGTSVKAGDSFEKNIGKQYAELKNTLSNSKTNPWAI